MAQNDSNSETAGFPGMPFPVNGMAAAQSVAHSVMRGNMEVMALASRRARAQLDFPKQAMGARTAAEFGQAGAQFWRDAFQDYMQFNQRMMGLWMHNMTSFGQGDMARQTAEFANRFAQPMTDAAEDTVSRMAEHPAEPWAWWRSLDTPSTRPSNNGHTNQESRGARVSY